MVTSSLWIVDQSFANNTHNRLERQKKRNYILYTRASSNDISHPDQRKCRHFGAFSNNIEIFILF